VVSEGEFVVEDNTKKFDGARGFNGDVTDDEGDGAVVVAVSAGGDEVYELEFG
jgi:hypothetical protein